MGQHLLDIRITGVHFEVAVHVATLLSVLIVYRERVSSLVVGAVRGEREAWSYVAMIMVASLPAAIIGLGLSGFIEAAFDLPTVTGVALIGTAAILWSSKIPLAKDLVSTPDWRSAVLIGLAQAIALIPGVSRSGATVVTALWLGIDTKEAAAFSFLMAIPVISGAALLQIPDLIDMETVGITTTALAAGGVVAGVTGILAIKTFLLFLEKKGFHSFGAYCALAGVAFLSFLYFAA